MASRSSGDTTKTATTTTVHHPFYSPIIHSALQQLANQTAASQRTETASRPIANRVDSSDDESNEIGRAATTTDDDNSSDSDDDSSDEEEEEAPSEEPLLADQLMVSAPPIISKANKRSGKKSKRVKKLNNPPCIVLPLPREDNQHDDNNNQPNQYPLALSIPTILLPNNYLRDNPNYDSSQVASHLLSTWTTLHRGIHSNNSNSSSSSPNTNNNNNNRSTILIILLQSGRFASAVYTLQKNQNHNKGSNILSMQMITHKTSTRYTVRKGQGGTQSTKDSSSKKPKSMGAQLRREGERQLRNDVVSTWKEWKRLGYLDNNVCLGVWMSVPKVMRKEYLFDEENALLLDKYDERIRSIPLDYGRPTLEAVEAVMECLMRCEVGPMRDVNVEQHYVDNDNNDDADRTMPVDKKSNGTTTTAADAMHNINEMEEDLPQVQAPPYTPLHEAVLAGDLTQVTELLKQHDVEQTTSQDESKQSTNTTTLLCDIDT
eukprot:scaffold50765_cov45-Cyclotella_meneghiniana.AAC.1